MTNWWRGRLAALRSTAYVRREHHECASNRRTALPKLLIVEDNELNRDMLLRRLARRGFEVVIANDGAEGLTMATSERPDLILMDMSLPVVDGWQATRQLKAAAETRHIPIIALTAHAMDGDERRARDAGCDDFDTKPVDLARLLGKIDALLVPARPLEHDVS